MTSAIASEGTVRRVRVLDLENPLTFEQDLGSFGETVPPRTGAERRTSEHREAYALRRLLLAWFDRDRLAFPLAVDRGMPGEEPDFIVSLGDGAPLGIECTEAGDPNWQRELTESEKKSTESATLLPGDGWAGRDGAERDVATQVAQAVLRKIDSYSRRGGQIGRPFPDFDGAVDLVIYDNTAAGVVVSDEKALTDHLVATLAPHHGFFRAIHLLRDGAMFLGIGGNAPEIVDLSRRYAHDFAAWSEDQALRIRSGAPLDVTNLAEEVEDLSKRAHRTVESLLGKIIEHLLMLEYSPADRPRMGWKHEIINFRSDLESELSPSIRNSMTESDRLSVKKAIYARARRATVTKLTYHDEHHIADILPEECPYTLDQVMDFDWLPDPVTK